MKFIQIILLIGAISAIKLDEHVSIACTKSEKWEPDNGPSYVYHTNKQNPPTTNQSTKQSSKK